MSSDRGQSQTPCRCFAVIGDVPYLIETSACLRAFVDFTAISEHSLAVDLLQFYSASSVIGAERPISLIEHYLLTYMPLLSTSFTYFCTYKQILQFAIV